MKLVIMCRVCRSSYSSWKKSVVLPMEYESKEAFRKDFTKLAISNYKRMAHNYGREAFFHFLGLRFEACDYYYEFSDNSDDNSHVCETLPVVLTLEEWLKEYKIPKEGTDA